MTSLLPRITTEALGQFVHSKHTAVPAMRKLMRAAQHATVRRSRFLLLTVPFLTDATLQCLDRCAATQAFGEVLAGSQFLLLAPAHRAIQRAKDPHRKWPGDTIVRTCPHTSAEGSRPGPRHCLIDQGARIERLAALRDAPDSATRLFSLRRLLALGTERPNVRAQNAIAVFCADPDPTLARIALWQLIRCDDDALRMWLSEGANSNHEEIRRLLDHRLALLAFRRLREAWPKPNPTRRALASRALIKIDTNFHHLVAERLKVTKRPARLRALKIISNLNQGAFFDQGRCDTTPRPSC